MENLFQIIVNSSSFTNIFILLSFILVLILTWKKKEFQGPEIKLPPGPPPLPLVGNIHQLVGALPFVALRDIALKYGPLVYLKVGQIPTVVVSSPEIAKEVLLNKDLCFADRPKRLALDILWYNYEDLVFTSYSDHWRKLRKICVTELLSKENVRSFRYIREDEIAKLTVKIQSNLKKPINLSEFLFIYSCSMTCRAALGNKCMINENFIEWTKEGLHLAGVFNVADLFPKFKTLGIISGLKNKLMKLHKDVDNFLDDVLNQHKLNHAKGQKGNSETGDEDLIDALLRHKDSTDSLDIPISDKNIKGIIFDICSAGTDATPVTVEWAMSELIRHPEFMIKAQKEVREVSQGKCDIDEADIKKMTYIKMVIKETMRLHPPTSIIPRACREDCRINGYTIPKNAHVALNIWAISRDPGLWDDPERFKPERFENRSTGFTGSDFQYFPFGSGRRMCPGLGFAMANIEIALANLLFHFDWSLPSGMKPKDLDMEEKFGIILTRKNSLNLIATAFHP